MRIVVSSITYEGIIRNKKELLDKLSACGNEIFIVAPESAKRDDIYGKFYSVTIAPHGKNPLKDYALYRQYIKIYKDIKPDIVMNLTIKPNVFSGLACRRLHIPYIGTINGVGDAIYNGGILSKITLMLLKSGLKQANCVFFQNKKNQHLFISKRIVAKEKTILVPGSGINITKHPYEEYPQNDKPVIFTFIGRISRDKGINELLEASRRLKAGGYEFVINVVGSCTDPFKEAVEEAHKQNIINYVGRVEPQAIHGILKESHAVLLPSYHEGIANVLLEGGAAGRPIIASYAEGCEETFDDGVSGIGFEPKSTNALVEAIKKFLDMSNDERRVMGINAHEKIVTEFNREIVDKAYIDKIKKI